MDIFLNILKYGAIALTVISGLAVTSVIVFCLLLYADWSKNGFH